MTHFFPTRRSSDLAEQVGALRGPVARRAGAIFLARDDDERGAVGLVAHRDVVDRQDFFAVARHAALDAGDHFVADADVGARAPHNDFVIAEYRRAEWWEMGCQYV